MDALSSASGPSRSDPVHHRLYVAINSCRHRATDQSARVASTGSAPNRPRLLSLFTVGAAYRKTLHNRDSLFLVRAGGSADCGFNQKAAANNRSRQRLTTTGNPLAVHSM